MGGCKCVYRNCTVKSDGKTHMFHFPVFDKIRCHQWLKNSHRLEFLNLKVCQLRNRVICQHHFRPECFMNYKMEKLKHNAIPTENGPFCDTSDFEEDEFNSVIHVDPDDIEHENLSSKEKKASMTVRFGDFLVRDGAEAEMQNLAIKDVSSNYGAENESSFPYPRTSIPIDFKKQPVLRVQPLCKSFQNEPKLENRGALTDETDSDKKKVIILSELKIAAPIPLSGKLEPVSPSVPIKTRKHSIPVVNMQSENLDRLPNTDLIFANTQINPQDQYNSHEIVQPQANSYTFSGQPIILHGNEQLQPGVQLIECSQAMPVINTEQQTDLQEIQELLNRKEILAENIEPQNTMTNSNLLSKAKIPPERMAEIEEKRKFNKKLRDMIEFCLDGLDVPEKIDENTVRTLREQGSVENQIKAPITEETTSYQKDTKEKISQNEPKIKPSKTERKANKKEQERTSTVISHLSEEPSLPNANKYVLDSIESRLRKMEENLLRKIDQNSQRIVELKDYIKLPHASNPKFRCTSSQTIEEEESAKTRLYGEIAQFLTPETRSIVFEEMFLEKYSKHKDKGISIQIEDTPEGGPNFPPKRRRKRR